MEKDAQRIAEESEAREKALSAAQRKPLFHLDKPEPKRQRGKLLH